MNRNQKNVAAAVAILIGCGVAIGAMATKIYLDKSKDIRNEVNRLKRETDFKLSREFLKELEEELKAELNGANQKNDDVANRVNPDAEAPVSEPEVLAEEVPVEEEIVVDVTEAVEA